MPTPPWCATGPTRRASKAASSTPTAPRPCWRESCRATGAAGPTSTAGWRPRASSRSGAGRSWTCTASTPTSRCSTPRCSARPSTATRAPPALDALADYRTARGEVRDATRALDALRRRRPRPRARGRPAPVPGRRRSGRRGHRRPRRGRARSRPRRRCSPTPPPTARRCHAPTTVARGRGARRPRARPGGARRPRRRSRRSRPACTRPRRRSPTSSASCGSRRSAVADDPARLEAVRARRHQLRELQRKYGDTLADVMAYAADTAARLAELEALRGRAPPSSRRRAARRERRGRRRGRPRSRGRGRTAAEPLARGVEAHLRELAMPHAHGRRRRGAGRSATDDGADPWCSSWRRTRASRPGRWPGPRPVASSPVRCWRRASC